MLKKDYTKTLTYNIAFACLSASTIYMTWTSLPSIEAWIFILSFLTLLGLTYLEVINPNE